MQRCSQILFDDGQRIMSITHHRATFTRAMFSETQPGLGSYDSHLGQQSYPPNEMHTTYFVQHLPQTRTCSTEKKLLCTVFICTRQVLNLSNKKMLELYQSQETTE